MSDFLEKKRHGGAVTLNSVRGNVINEAQGVGGGPISREKSVTVPA